MINLIDPYREEINQRRKIRETMPVPTIDTRIKDIDPLTYDIINFVININVVNVLEIQMQFDISLERASSILDYGVDKGYLIQPNYLNYQANISLEQLNEEFKK